MVRPGGFGFTRTLRLMLLLSFFTGIQFVQMQAEVIYDNTGTYLNRFFNEKTEYGDQVDLSGTARRLTQILFEYYGAFEEDGDEMVRLRLYTNETPYDRFRKAPTTLLFESAWLPITPGFNTRAVGGLNVQLPPHTVTVTAEFAGIDEDEVAGLLFYDPPTIGYSFNEIWLRGATGLWVPVLYSSTDPTKRASVGLRLVAEPEISLDQHQTNVTSQVALVHETNRLRLAQTFRPAVSGRLNDVSVSVEFTNAPVRVRILDVVGHLPGPNVLGERFLLRGSPGKQTLSFVDEGIYLRAGTSYAIELSTAHDSAEAADYRVAVSRDNYNRGQLWSRREAGGSWTAVTENNDGHTFLDAVFETYMIPTEPDVQLTSPQPGQTFDLGEPIELRAVHRPLEIGTLAHIRFMNGAQEIGRVTNAPYTFLWTNAPPGEHNLRAIVEDSFRRPFRSEIIPIEVLSAGAPENDDFARRLHLTGTAARSIKLTSGARLEPGEPRVPAGNSGGTVWWSWTAYDNSPVTISAQNSSDPGATVGVFMGDTLGTLIPVTNGSPRVVFTPMPGSTYAIVVDPKNRDDQVVLDLAAADVRIQRISPGVLRATAPVVLALTGSSTRQIKMVSILTNGSSFATVSGSPAAVTNAFRTNGIFSVVVVATDERGIQTISAPMQVTVRPENDAFRHAKNLIGFAGTVPFSSLAATPELIDPIWFGENSHSLWYQWRAPAAGSVEIETPARHNDAAFGVYTARTNGALVLLDLVAEMDGTNRLTFEATAGRLYYFFVADAEPELSSFNFELTVFQIERLTMDSGVPSLSFATELKERIHVETSTNLVTWQRTGETITGMGGEVTWADTAPQRATEKARFYRIVRE
jgi:hypothetical protein